MTTVPLRARGWGPLGRAVAFHLQRVAVNVITVGSEADGCTWLGAARLQATLRETRALRQLARETIARSRAGRAKIQSGRSQREILHDSAFARLAAQQETMAVIEQAKGVIMAQHECGPEEAFDLLRRASQRANIKVNVLAAQIVAQIAANGNQDNVTPITVGAARYPRPGTPPRPPVG